MNQINKNNVFGITRSMFLAILMLLSIMPVSASAVDTPTNIYRITENAYTDANIDAAEMSDGTPCVVYDRASKVYMRCGLKPEVYVADGTKPIIDFDSNDNAHIVYALIDSYTYVGYIYQTADGWSTPLKVAKGFGPVLDIDDNDTAHIVYSVDSDGGGYNDVLYTNNQGGSFSSTAKIFDSGYRSYYTVPALAVDKDGHYHIVSAYHAMDCWYKCYHTYIIAYATNKPGVSGSSSPDHGSNGETLSSIAIDSNNQAHVIYNAGGNVYSATPSPWSEVVIGPGSAASIDSDSNSIYGYSNGASVYFASDSSSPYLVDSGANAVPVIGNSNYLYYAKSGEIYVATSGVLSPCDPGYVLVPGTTDTCVAITCPTGLVFDLDFPGFCAPQDLDSDGIFDIADNCPSTPNPDQADSDNDGIGDACDESGENVSIPEFPVGALMPAMMSFMGLGLMRKRF